MKHKVIFNSLIICILLIFLIILGSCSDNEVELPVESPLSVSDAGTEQTLVSPTDSESPTLSTEPSALIPPTNSVSPSPSVEPGIPASPPSVEPSISPSTSRAMSEVELSQLTEAFHYPFENPELISFLTCIYNTPCEINLNEVFYNGAGRFTTPTDEQKDYLAANGYDIDPDWRNSFYPDGTFWDDTAGMLLALSTIDDILQRRLGISLSQVQEEFGLYDPKKRPWEWVEEYEAYFTRRTDVNIGEAQFISGQYIGNDTYAADYYTGGCGNLSQGTYRVTFMMTDDDTDTIQFISNVSIS